MLTEKRHSLILERLKQFGVVQSQELMVELDCSESTIRRDLDMLEQAKQLKRIHGGAKRLYHLDDEQTMHEKTFKNIHEKQAIGQLAASFINKNDVIFLDAGSSTYAMIPFLSTTDHITVVTNGIQHASTLAEQQIETYLLGGKIKQTTKAVIGAKSLQQLADYRFDKVFLGINGIDASLGCTTPDPEEATLKQSALGQSAISYVLADHSKWDKVSFVKVCSIDEVCIITDKLTTSHSQKYNELTTIMEAIK
ncbi:DeoR/GlpR family DNA-binding transcription regulator [Radiobacillus sp. PE A8.2]|uniref:DeoR/GlpR family DNA-binding transcription regulator n=1 Tax=Radiobacillus sp. PE A8.2 TaxID=3380349 RepID=UPI00388DA1FF